MKATTKFTASAAVLNLSASAPPSQIELMPLGDITLADERGLVGKVTDAAALIARSMAAAKGGMLPIDFGHGMDGDAGADPRAAGWITALSVVGDRIMANVEWTPVGSEALDGKLFRFISPTFTAPEDGGEVGLILRAGLTNDPALPELAKLASQQETPKMPEWLKQLAAKLGMADETDEAKITAAVNAKIDEAERVAPIVTAAGLTGALTEEAATAITAKITAAAKPAAPDLTKFVPIATYQAATARVAELEKTGGAAEVRAAVTAAMQAGKLPPADEQWGMEVATANLEHFKKLMASSAVVVDPKVQTPSGDPDKQEGALTKLELEVIAASGITKEAFLATKQGKPLPAAKTEA